MRGAASPDGASAWPYIDGLDLSVLRRRGPAVVHQIGLGFASPRIYIHGADELPPGSAATLGREETEVYSAASSTSARPSSSITPSSAAAVGGPGSVTAPAEVQRKTRGADGRGVAPQRLRAAQALAQRGNRFADEDHEDIVDRDAGGRGGELARRPAAVRGGRRSRQRGGQRLRRPVRAELRARRRVRPRAAHQRPVLPFDPRSDGATPIGPRVSLTLRRALTLRDADGRLHGQGARYADLNWPTELQGVHRLDDDLEHARPR